MIKIRSITARNFMSIGNATQSINFENTELTLILGQNLDLGGDDTGARNGTGKTTILNALSFGLYGEALANIKVGNMINRTNGKNMLVTVDLEVDGTSYRIERGRNPTFVKFFIDGREEQETMSDESQGDSRETKTEITKMLGLSHDMFKHILALNAYTEPFLSLRANGQREIIEQLLGVTILTEKAEKLKEAIKVTKKAVDAEEIRVKAIDEANQRVQTQIDGLKRRQKLWTAKHEQDIVTLERALRELCEIDIDIELENHRALSVWSEAQRKDTQLRSSIKRLQTQIKRESDLHVKTSSDIASLEQHKCHACGQDLHDAKHEEIVAAKRKQLEECEALLAKYAEEETRYDMELQLLGEVGKQPKVFYDTLEQALEHKNSVDTLVKQIEIKHGEVDPYGEQIEDMENQAIQEVSWDAMNELTKVREHQDFLLKLLTNKDSFVRKKIIDQNLTYLNQRLTHYLNAIGLPHEVKFLNDLSTEITELGRDLDFDNLSRGERTRVILSLSWAFRDVWESLYKPINLLFVDELADNGLDASGLESTLGILKGMARDRRKSVFLVSHREELGARVNSTLMVTKLNGFTTYGNQEDL